MILIDTPATIHHNHVCCASASWVISATSSGDMRLLLVISTYFLAKDGRFAAHLTGKM